MCVLSISFGLVYFQQLYAYGKKDQALLVVVVIVVREPRSGRFGFDESKSSALCTGLFKMC